MRECNKLRIPDATYRIQFRPGFGFEALRRRLDYLKDLGISDIYASPVLRPRSGSQHGYDLVDPNEINPELGGREGLESLLAEVRQRGMGWLQDLVPNHMAFHKENWMLMDVLENGQASDFFGFFDVDWEHMYEGIRGRILAPFLGKFYGECLEAGEIRLEYREGGFGIHYHEQAYPVRIESYARILSHRIEELRDLLGEDHLDFIKILGMLYSLKTLPGPDQAAQRKEQVRFVKRLLWETYQRSRVVRDFIEENLSAFNGDPKDPSSFDLLEDLLEEQFFRLSFWKVATEEINYRRFFNINDLISLRVEEEKVFEHVHSLFRELSSRGLMTGFRVDHVDGLYDPTLYLSRLRGLAPEAFLVVEKVCGFGEDIPETWPVQGTTGYDFLNLVNGLFCDKKNRGRFDRLYRWFCGLDTSYEDLVREKKLLIAGKHMAGDIDNLAHLLKGASSRMRSGSDITLYGLKRALVEVMAHFPVYRTYRTPNASRASDQCYILRAVEQALQSNPGLSKELEFIERFLLQEWERESSQRDEKGAWHFVMRFQQFTGPLMAKGLEDTAFYIFNRLISLNEVGGFPERFGVSIREFHEQVSQRASQWPHTMNTTSTHDTKRGEDVRARINVLSEIPEEWERHLRSWSKINSRNRLRVRGHWVPGRNEEYFLYQTLLGTFPFALDEVPLFVKRLKEFCVKAIREAKVHTAWLKPDEEYEQAFLSFVDRVLDPSPENDFLRSFMPFQRKIAYYGVLNSLSQTLLKMAAPGVPDFYQGTELWDLTFVDPDNRRPVDFDLRERFMKEIKERAVQDLGGLIRELWDHKEDGRIKMFLIHRVLQFRRHHRELFRHGTYLPLDVQGALGSHVICFARKWQGQWVLAVAPRHLTKVVSGPDPPLGTAVWGDTMARLPEEAPGLWVETISGEHVRSEEGGLSIGQLLSRFPVGLALGQVGEHQNLI